MLIKNNQFSFFSAQLSNNRKSFGKIVLHGVPFYAIIAHAAMIETVIMDKNTAIIM